MGWGTNWSRVIELWEQQKREEEERKKREAENITGKKPDEACDS